MKTLICLLLIFGLVTVCSADEIYRVSLEKSTGKLIEMQSGNAPLGTLTQNAVNGGYVANDVEEKYVTEKEWKEIKKLQIDNPAKQKATIKKEEELVKRNLIINKLKAQGWSDEEIIALIGEKKEDDVEAVIYD